jgi:hypothetical protein
MDETGCQSMKSFITTITVKKRGEIPSKPIQSNPKVYGQIELMEKQLLKFQDNFVAKISQPNEKKSLNTQLSEKCLEAKNN